MFRFLQSDASSFGPEEDRLKIEHEREPSPNGLLVAQDDEKSTRGFHATLPSGPYAGLKSAKKRARHDVDPEEGRLKIKREREPSPKDLFIAQDDENSTRGFHTTFASGPYAGLKSAKKRARQDVDLEEEEPNEAALDESVDEGEASKTSYGPAKKVARKSGAVLKDV